MTDEKSLTLKARFNYFCNMADVFDQKTRSYIMSRVKGKDTKPEMIVRKYLFSKGFRYRLHVNKLQGKPDIVLLKYKTVVFINGCFWHGHDGCKHFSVPKTNTEWWLNKIIGNISKDTRNIESLTREGWSVLVIWECELTPRKREITLNKLMLDIKN